MTTKSKPTAGPWTVRQLDDDCFVEGSEVVGRTMAGDYKREILSDEEYEAKLADAKLIAEAGTVYHETGLTPRELVLITHALSNEWEVEKVSLYDEEGIEGWRWKGPNNQEFEIVGDWDKLPAVNDELKAAIAAVEKGEKS